MRHLVKGKKLGRTTSHRKATMQALSVALIQHERINTTLAKAKELRLHVEPIITRSKKDTQHNRRIAFSFLRDKAAVTKLFDEIGELVADRPGGYTRIIKLGKRAGDNADVAMIELVDYNDETPETTGKKKKRTRRAGRGKGTSEAAVTAKANKGEKQNDKAKEENAEAEPVKEEKAKPDLDTSAKEVSSKEEDKTATKAEKADDSSSDGSDKTKEEK